MATKQHLMRLYVEHLLRSERYTRSAQRERLAYGESYEAGQRHGWAVAVYYTWTSTADPIYCPLWAQTAVLDWAAALSDDVLEAEAANLLASEAVTAEVRRVLRDAKRAWERSCALDRARELAAS